MQVVLARVLAAGLVAAAVAVLGGCRVEREPNVDFLPWLDQMVVTREAESYSTSTIFANGRTLQVPPAGTIPRGFQPLHYLPADVTRRLPGDERNPEPASDAVLARGQVLFATFCAPCHGTLGAGDGPVSKLGMPGFPINNPKAGAGLMPDGQVFRLISYGRGVMPSYATQISQVDRWRIIHHLRRLQAAQR